MTLIQSKVTTGERDNQSDRCKARLQQVSGHNQSDSDTEQKLQQVSGHNQSDRARLNQLSYTIKVTIIQSKAIPSEGHNQSVSELDCPRKRKISVQHRKAIPV